MLIIKFIDGSQIIRYIPDVMTLKGLPIDDVKWIQADENELDQIKSKFQQHNTPFKYNIPMPRNQKFVSWYGDIAKTILAGLM